MTELAYAAGGELRGTVSPGTTQHIFCHVLSRFKAGSAGCKVLLSSSHLGHSMDLYGEQSPKICAAPPYVCGIGLSIKRQRNAVKRLRRTSNSHLPPPLLPNASLAAMMAAHNPFLLNPLRMALGGARPTGDIARHPKPGSTACT